MDSWRHTTLHEDNMARGHHPVMPVVLVPFNPEIETTPLLLLVAVSLYLMSILILVFRDVIVSSSDSSSSCRPALPCSFNPSLHALTLKWTCLILICSWLRILKPSVKTYNVLLWFYVLQITKYTSYMGKCSMSFFFFYGFETFMFWTALSSYKVAQQIHKFFYAERFIFIFNRTCVKYFLVHWLLAKSFLFYWYIYK